MRRGLHKLLTRRAPPPTLHPQSTATFATKSRRSHSSDNDARRRRPPPPLSASEGRFQLHKSRGQHLLTNPRVLDSIVQRAQVRPTDTVLEIGPGTGNLTVRLLEAAAKVVAVEIDERMVDALCRRVEGLGVQDRLTSCVQL